MKNNVKRLAAAILLAAALPVSVQAEKAVAPMVSPTAAVEGGRELQVIVSQSEIKSDIVSVNYAAQSGGGLLPALIDASINSGRAKKAEAAIAPVRDAIADFDIDALALNSAKSAFGDAEWFKANPVVKFAKDSSATGKNAMLDGTGASQIAFVEYVYDVTPEFDAIRAVATIAVAEKAIPPSAKGKAEKRLHYKNLLYSAQATSIIKLPQIDDTKEGNAALWSADGGALARRALEAAFVQLAALTQRTLALTPDDFNMLNDKRDKPVDIGGYVGRLQTPPVGSTLLWNGGYIQISKLN